MRRYMAITLAVSLFGSAFSGVAAYSAVVHPAPIHLTMTMKQKCPAWPSGTGILRDGDFSGAVAPPGLHYNEFSAGQRFAPDWRVRKRTVDMYDAYFPLPNGVCSIDLDGSQAGAIVHSGFATTPGASYTVAFLFSANGLSGPTVKTLLVLAAGQSQQYTWDISTQGDVENGDYETESWTFQATASSTRLIFESLDPKNSLSGPVVAAISVTENT